MARTLIFTDSHVHPHKKSADRLEDCLKALEWVFQTALERGIEDIVFGGDLLHDRQRIEVLTYQRVWEVLSKYMTGDLRLWLLLGNHDLWYATKWTVTSVMPFSALPGVRIIDKPCRLKVAGENFDFIPYTHDPIAAVAELRKLPGEAPYAVGHIALHGAQLNSHGTQADVVIEHDGDMVIVDPKIFDHYQRVFLGHYHCAQQLNDIVEYVGSPLQLSFGEAHQKKHILDFDVSRNKKTYIENTFSPKHLYVRQDRLDQYDLKKNFVVVLADDLSAADVVTMRQELVKDREVASLTIRQNKKPEVDDSVIKDAKSILLKEDEMLERYMKEVPPPAGLDHALCLNFGMRITVAEKKVDIDL